MILFYCTADGTGPEPMIDWPTELAEARQKFLADLSTEERQNQEAVIAAIDAAHAEVGAAANAIKSHVVRNGNHPFAEITDGRIDSEAVAIGLLDQTFSVLIGDDRDTHGGGIARLVRTSVSFDLGCALLCPECSAPVRAVKI